MIMGCRYKAVIFDLHDTLIHCQAQAPIEDVPSDQMVMVPCKNTVRMLRYLKKQGVMIGLLTRCARSFTEYCLRICHLDKLIDTEVCAFDYPEVETKPNPIAVRRILERLEEQFRETIPLDRCLFVGDTYVDYLCSLSAGIDFLGFAYNDRQRTSLTQMGVHTDSIIADYQELIDRFEAQKSLPK